MMSDSDNVAIERLRKMILLNRMIDGFVSQICRFRKLRANMLCNLFCIVYDRISKIYCFFF